MLSAQILFEKRLYDTSIYHTHQCAEKALKGFLAFKNLPIQKTHDLVLLKNLCAGISNDFNDLTDAVIFLNGRDVQYRYPLEEMDPAEEEVKEAISFANEILVFIRSLMK